MVKTTVEEVRLLSYETFGRAKQFWGGTFSLKLVATCFGIGSILAGASSSILTGAIVVLAIVAELLQWRSDALKAQAEALLRKVELFDGLGIKVPAMDVGDHLATLSKRRRKKLEKALEDSNFASKDPPGPRRACMNLRESAWWSKHLLGAMFRASLTVTVIAIGGCLAALYIALAATPDKSDAEMINKVVAGVLSAVISLGLLKSTVAYYGASAKAQRLEERVRDQLAAAVPGELDALRLLGDYHLARASWPLIPDAVWRLRRADLNDLWSKFGAEERGDDH